MILRKLRRIASRLLAKAHSVDVTTVTWFSPGPSQHLMSSARKIAPFGSWPSPLNAAEVTANSTRLEEVRIDSAKSAGTIYWSEMRPSDGGRNRICSWSRDGDGKVVQWTKGDFNARTRVHEYGGGSFFVYEGVVYFSNFMDQVMYRQTSPDVDPVPVTPTGKGWRYADGVCSKGRVFCVREDHGENGDAKPSEVKNVIVSFGVQSQIQEQSVLVEGCDFYASPRVSPDGSSLAWMQWNHPNMPWDSTEIWCAKLSDDGSSLVQDTKRKISGGDGISVMTPMWSPSNVLHYISDESNWWNLYVSKENESPVPVIGNKNEEIGLPHWQFGNQGYAFNPENPSKIALTYNGDLSLVDVDLKSSTPIKTGFRSHRDPLFCSDGHLFVLASSSAQFPAILDVNSKTGDARVVYSSRDLTFDAEYISVPKKITYPSGKDLKEESHAYFYAPKNKDYAGPDGELPPLLVRAHGGPTASASSSLNLQHQYWTSRGVAVLDVDYRGSTGYGRRYRDRLKLNWGICDVEDCCEGARYLVKQKLVDGKRLTIDGGSAGGFTTLAALAFDNVFNAGCSKYGVADLVALQLETHKFESRYLDQLIAPWPEGRPVYDERSPINHVDKLNCSVIFFQGDEDKIVPPNQSETMYEALKKKGITTSYVLFEGEQHGFRKKENVIACLEGELYFFGKVLGFQPADDIKEPPKIDNL
ncbi:uncharacterized protein [Oscarella lobularis]|uniref:uncharacterized protein n=1 Tax=Oscarella lobularis TaxID=121494 RepID=UPI003314065A